MHVLVGERNCTFASAVPMEGVSRVGSKGGESTAFAGGRPSSGINFPLSAHLREQDSPQPDFSEHAEIDQLICQDEEKSRVARRGETPPQEEIQNVYGWPPPRCCSAAPDHPQRSRMRRSSDSERASSTQRSWSRMPANTPNRHRTSTPSSTA